MKKIEAIIRPERLQDVQDALDGLGVSGLTVSDVVGCGRQKGYTEQYRGSRANISLLPKIKVESVVPQGMAEAAVDAIVGGRPHRRHRRRPRVRLPTSSRRSASAPASAARRRSATRRRRAGATRASPCTRSIRRLRATAARLQPSATADAEDGPGRPEVAGAGGQPDPDQEHVDDRELAGRGAQRRGGAARRAASGSPAEVRVAAPAGLPSTPQASSAAISPRPSSGQTGQAFGAPVSAQTIEDDQRHAAQHRAAHAQPRRAARLQLRRLSVGRDSGRRGRARWIGRLTGSASGIAAPHLGALARRALRRRACPSSAPTRSCSPCSPEPSSRAAPPTAVVADGHDQLAGLRRDGDRRASRLRVLVDVGQALRDDEVGSRLDLVGQALLRRGDHLDRHGRAAGEVLERRGQAAVGEDRRVDAAREVAQLLQRQAGLVARLARSAPPPRRRPLGRALLGHAQRQRERHEALLGAVVEVALDAAALGVGGLDDARARVPQVGHLGGQLPGRCSSPAAPPRSSRRGGRARSSAGMPEQQHQRAERHQGERLARAGRP